MQGAHCAIEGLLFVNVVSIFLKQFPRTLDNSFFCFSNATGDLGGIRFKNGSSVKGSPVRNLGGDKGAHNYHPEEER